MMHRTLAGTRHVFGLMKGSGFNLSPAIVAFDPVSMAIKTQSGAIYQLSGKPQDHTLIRLFMGDGQDLYIDVSDQYWNEI
ncbi:MAG: hypothetical protein ACYC3N_00075 [Halothiobacillus sp.]